MGMGRKKILDPKSVQIRITRNVRRELGMIKTKYNLPARYKEGDVVEALLWIVRGKELQLQE
jgi:hypothetical protein